MILTVIVTYNRIDKLKESLIFISRQTVKSDVLVVDNASSDGTREYLKSLHNIHLRLLDENIGGAGGFALGMDFAVKNSYDWVWVMDDDAFAAPDALKALSLHMNDVNKENILLSHLVDSDYVEVSFQPSNFITYEDYGTFVGFCISTEKIKKIGLPNRDLFIYWDDYEYSLRSKTFGGVILRIHDSLIYHKDWQKRDLNSVKKFGRTFNYSKTPGWRAYYLVRNDLYVHKKAGARVLSKRIAVNFRYLINSALTQSENVPFVLKGIRDGLMGRLGKRI